MKSHFPHSGGLFLHKEPVQHISTKIKITEMKALHDSAPFLTPRRMP